MQRMTDLLLDLLDCEVQFKQQYFEAPLQTNGASRSPFHALATTGNRQTSGAHSPPLNYSVISLTNSSKSSRARQPAQAPRYREEE